MTGLRWSVRAIVCVLIGVPLALIFLGGARRDRGTPRLVDLVSAEVGKVQVTVTADATRATAALLSLTAALHRFGLHRDWLMPRPLVIDGAAYRRRTRRRKP